MPHRHRFSTAYLEAIRRYLGADTFGDTRERQEGAKLIARLAGRQTEDRWLQLRAEVRLGSADTLIRETRDIFLPIAARVAEARKASDEVALSPLPAEDSIYYLAVAERALDYAVAHATPGAERMRFGCVLRDCQQALLDLAARQQEEANRVEQEAEGRGPVEVARKRGAA